MTRIRSSARTRHVLTAVAFVAATVVGGSVLPMASADVSSGDRGVFVPIVPCRLFDTRFGESVGPRTFPLGPGDAFAQQVRGANGLCNIPSDATGVALNVTIVNPTASGYLTVWPSDAPQPLASNLNWRGGDPPTPNKVDVKLSADGRISFYNSAGYVDILGDAVGYYANHNHDDRYYTKAQDDAALAAKANKPTGTTQLVVDASAFTADIDANGDTTAFAHDYNDGYVTNIGASTLCAAAPVMLPAGVTVTSMLSNVYDANGSVGVAVTLYRSPRGSAGSVLMAGAQTSGPAAPGTTSLADITITDPVIDTAQNGYFVSVCLLTTTTRLYDVAITYTNP